MTALSSRFPHACAPLPFCAIPYVTCPPASLCLPHLPSLSYPATPLLLARARFCISAGHTREDMDFALEQIEAVADLCHIRYRKYING